MSIKVSVIIPVFNEEKYIANCIKSLLNQTFPKDQMEWLFLDGNSSDLTVSIIDTFVEQYPALIRIISNPNRTQAYAMNIGTKEAKGKYIVRLDAHADYDKSYIKECVRLLDTGEYDNVGGIAETRSRSEYGEVIACMMSSKFGVGNSQFRTSEKGGLVDTVPFGAFRREYLQEIGGFDERLDRNEDNEINYRIRSRGGKVFLSPTIKFTYYCRDTLSGILRMAFQNGKWTIIASKYCPGSMSFRHLIPFAFVISLLVLTILSLNINIFSLFLTSEIGLYLVLDLIFSYRASKNFYCYFNLLYLFPAFHISYGIGSICGICHIHKSNAKRRSYG